MRWTRYVLSLGLLCLILFGCVHQIPLTPVRLPEPALPTCLVEQTPPKNQAVGAFEFKESFVAFVAEEWDKDARISAQRIFQCASEIGKALREAITVIRVNNRDRP